MMVGYPPFFSDEPSVTCQKIMRWQETLTIPKDAKLSPQAESILKCLLCASEDRLGVNGVEEIKSHEFFKKVDWENIRNKPSPFKPEFKTNTDCKRFDKFEEEEPFHPQEDKRAKKARKDINFIGYTYKKDLEEQKQKLVEHLKDSITQDLVNNDKIKQQRRAGEPDSFAIEQQDSIQL